MTWRQDKKIDNITEVLKTKTWEQWPGFEQVHPNMPMFVIHPDPNKGLIAFQRLAETDLDNIANISEEAFLDYQFHLKEWLYVRRDKVRLPVVVGTGS